MFNSTYDLRFLLRATSRLRDGAEIDIPGPKFIGNRIIERLDHTQIGQLLTDFELVGVMGGVQPRVRSDDAIA